MELTNEIAKFYSVYSLEQATRYIEKCLLRDNCAPTLYDVLNICQNCPTASGLTDHDYPNLSAYAPSSNSMVQIKLQNKVPLPSEILEHFNYMQNHCMMGLFSEINRAWLTIDSDIYIWAYEDSSDVAYFDGLTETIVSVGLIQPKAGVFQNYIRYLLVIATSVDIVILGVLFTAGSGGPLQEIQLIPDPVFSIPTDGCTITSINGTKSGRILLGAKDGSLFEISYQSENSWFGKRWKKINHSTSAFSFLVPYFLNLALGDEDPIIQISIDNSRNILYTLSEKGSIEVYDMGEKGNGMSRITRVTQASLVQQAVNIVKTLDSQNFRPIVSISAVEISDSLQINLVAITQTGVRFYLTTVSLSNQQLNLRPYTLTLAHVRLPPGYSANMTTRPRMVHMSKYSERNLIMLSTVNEKDVLWCITSDLFPFSPILNETYTTFPLDSPALAMAEVSYPGDENYVVLKPPLVVRQHAEPPKKFIVLTSQGIYVFLKLRPVDVLKNLLQESHGLESEMVKTYFRIQGEDQACAASLILACLSSAQNQEVAEYATKVFFMLGGEPKLLQPTFSSPADRLGNTTMFQPNIVSTPARDLHQMNVTYSPYQSQLNVSNPQFAQKSIMESGPFLYSSKHDGLYLYLSRILRPIWNLHCVERFTTDSKKVFFTSVIDSEKCSSLLNHLKAFKNFILINTQLSYCNNGLTPSQVPPPRITAQPNVNFSIQDAQLQERHSLDALKSFTVHACEILGLWRILSEHQIHVLLDTLTDGHKQVLEVTAFKDLIMIGSELCTAFISALINSYLNDDACVDSISIKLREVCPNLYKMEDEAYSKANEILKKAKVQLNVDEKNELIMSALDICKKVAPHLNLHNICEQFTQLKAYDAVVELVMCCAKKKDPEHVGEHFFKNGDQNDQDAYKYYAERMEIYNEVLFMLENIYTTDASYQQKSFQGSVSIPNGILSQSFVESNMLMKEVISFILQQEDELLQVSLYEWMMSKQMTGDLIKIPTPTLETFLLKTAQRHPDNTDVLDLLWKYYESNNNHASAAKVLNNLAQTPQNGLILKERLSCLARAIMCMRSDKTGYAPYLGVFLRELEDKIEIAKVQELLLDSITNLRGIHPNAEEAMQALNSAMFDITQLYENFAEPFNLWECKLAIIECAGYSDNKLIENIWYNIMQNIVNESRSYGNDKIVQIFAKMKPLLRKYKSSVNCFPLSYIIQELEVISCKLKADKALLPELFVSLDIPLDLLLRAYVGILTLSLADRFWSQEDNELHLAEVIANIIRIFVNQTNSNSVEKRKMISLCQDTIATILSNLYTKTNADDLINIFRGLEMKLKRL